MLSSSGATQGSESSGKRKPIGESPGNKNMCSDRKNHVHETQRARLKRRRSSGTA